MPEDTSSAKAVADANYRIGKTKLGSGSTSSKPILSAAEQKKLDDEEQSAFEKETGKKFGWGTTSEFQAWKKKRAARTGQAAAVKDVPAPEPPK